MNHDFLVLLWQHRLFDDVDLMFHPSGEYRIVSQGVRMEGAAADFSNVHIVNTASGEILRGGAKLNQRSSCWRNEGTVGDAQYDNIVLHVVSEYDTQLLRNGEPVLTCELKPNARLLQKMGSMQSSCPQYLAKINAVERAQIITRLLDERIERKTNDALRIFDSTQNRWHDMAFILFMRAMGSWNSKSDQFEAIARSLNYSYISMHVGRPALIEAVLLGQAGYLDVESSDIYVNTLRAEYKAVRAERGILPAVVDWSRVVGRPGSVPALSLVQAASILSHRPNLFVDIINCETLRELRQIFEAPVAPYWTQHNAPTVITQRDYSILSPSKIDLLVINFVIVLLFFQTHLTGDTRFVERAVRFYEQLPCESNSIVGRWHQKEWRPQTAYDSQAIIQLSRLYCQSSLCGSCPIGSRQIFDEWKKYHNFAL